MSEPVEVKSLRALDALVAERVMGCKVWWDEDRPTCGCSPSNYEYPHGREIDGGVYVDVKDYSTDIAAAWEVVEVFVGRGDHVAVNGWNEKPNWDCGIIDYPKKEHFFASKAATATLAICLAALKAVGVEVELKLP